MTTAAQERPLETLTQLLDADQVITNQVELITYERDGTLRAGQPDGVVLPRSLDDVVRVVRWAAEHHTPLVARGAGTGLSGGAVAEGGGVIVSFSRMNRILEFDIVGGLLVTEPGVTNQTLDETVKRRGLYFPPDPSSGRSATIGGNIGENSGGPHCFKCGVTTNYINGLEVVLGNGRTARFGGPALDYPEYDFISLFAGGEGTLGLVAKAQLRLMRNPPAVKTMMAAFESVAKAGNAVSAVIARGLVPATLEMMDQKMMGIIEAYVHVGLPVEAGAALIVEVDGYAESLAGQIDEIADILRQHSAGELRVTQTAEERDALWYGRKSAFGAMARLAPSYSVLDGTVPRSRLADALVGVGEICDSLDLRVANVFHAGDGNLHPLILIEDPYDEELLNRVHEAGSRIMKLCLELGGSITGEHGVGAEKREYMRIMYNTDELAAMRDVKQVFDSTGLFNPAKVLPDFASAASDATQPPPVSRPSPYAPLSAEEAADAMRGWMADEHPVYLQGAGTKFDPPAGEDGCVLTTRGLRGIVKYAPEDLYVTVRTGMPLATLQAELMHDGVWVPLVSPWPTSTLGGILASNFNAPLRARYGAIRDLVMDSTAVLPDGRIVRVGRPVVKNVAGYDLHRLFVGAYGTLGLVTEVSLRLLPLPRARASLVVPFDDLEQGLLWGTHLLPVCLTASALLLCGGFDGLSTGDEAPQATPYMLVYTAEGVPDDVRAELGQARSVLQAAGATGILESEQVSGSEVWAAWLESSASGAGNGELARLGVGRKDLPSLVTTLAPRLSDTSYCADLANGLLYVRNVTDLSPLRDAAQELDGYAVIPASPDGTGAAVGESAELMRRLKARWDAHGLLNPGLLIPR